jgi:hypothetical protein
MFTVFRTKKQGCPWRGRFLYNQGQKKPKMKGLTPKKFSEVFFVLKQKKSNFCEKYICFVHICECGSLGNKVKDVGNVPSYS